MAMSYRARRRLSLVVLVLGLPIYIVVAVNLIDLLDRPPLLVELAIYSALGVLWALPLRSVFLGVGRPDPEAQGEDAGGHGETGRNEGTGGNRD